MGSSLDLHLHPLARCSTLKENLGLGIGVSKAPFLHVGPRPSGFVIFILLSKHVYLFLF